MDSSSLIYDLTNGLFNPLLYPFDPSRRVFVGFLLIAILMAFFVYAANNTDRSCSAFLKYFFKKDIWLHKSSKLDFKLLFANSSLSAAFIVPFIVTKLTIIVWVSSGLRTEFGAVENQIVPYWSIILLFTVTIFFIEDFNRFFLHRCYHKIPFLWEFHKVHHSAEVLTPFTLYRTHPVEIIISRTGSVLVIGFVTGIFVYLFPGQLSALEILGVDLLGFIFNALGANLRHSHIPFSFGRLDHWFISPSMHQIHHSELKQHHDKNFGSCFAVWDRMLGSLYHPSKNEPLSFGCQNSGDHTLTSQWFSPFSRIIKQSKYKKVVTE